MNDKQKQIAYDIKCKVYNYIESNPKKYTRKKKSVSVSEDYNVYVCLTDEEDGCGEYDSYVRHKKSGGIYTIAVYKVKTGVNPIARLTYPGHYGG